MSMPAPPRNNSNEDETFSYDAEDTVNVEVMPLVSGYIHFPYIILHRYLRRGSSELGMCVIPYDLRKARIFFFLLRLLLNRFQKVSRCRDPAGI